MRYNVTREAIIYLQMEADYQKAMRDGDYTKANLIDNQLGTYANLNEDKIFTDVSNERIEL